MFASEYRVQRCGGVLSIVLVIAGLSTSRVAAQQTTLDPYRPFTRNLAPFADPGASVRGGFPNALGGQAAGRLSPFDLGYGGFDPFAPPYFNRNISPSLDRSVSTYSRSLGDYSRRAQNLNEPQDRADRDFYQKLADKADPYESLEKNREELYFEALSERDPKKKAELMRQYQKATRKSAQAISAQRRSSTGTEAGSAATTSRRRTPSDPNRTTTPRR